MSCELNQLLSLGVARQQDLIQTAQSLLKFTEGDLDQVFKRDN